MRISDWSSDVCSADLLPDWIGRIALAGGYQIGLAAIAHHGQAFDVGGLPNPVDRGDLHGSGPIGRVHGEAPDRDILLPHLETPRLAIDDTQSDESRVGKECVSTCRSRWAPYNYKIKKSHANNASIKPHIPP